MIFKMIKIWLQDDSCVILYFSVVAEYISMQSTEHRIVTLPDVSSCSSVIVVTKKSFSQKHNNIFQQCQVCYMFHLQVTIIRQTCHVHVLKCLPDDSYL